MQNEGLDLRNFTTSAFDHSKIAVESAGLTHHDVLDPGGNIPWRANISPDTIA
jgi:hypothetical protein